MLLPVNLNVSGRLCVIVGGGKVANRKCRKLLDYGARLRVVSTDFRGGDEVWNLPDVELVRRPFTREDLAGAFFVVAATDDPAVNRQVLSHAIELDILAQQVDSPGDSDFTFPATLRRGDFTVSFATDGAIPALSARMKEEAARRFGTAYGDFCALARSLRVESMRGIPAERRKDFFKRLAEADVLDLFVRGEKASAHQRALEIFNQFGHLAPEEAPDLFLPSEASAESEPGEVFLVGAGCGDPGLLTVKGAECLRSADAVLYDGMVNPVLLEIYCPRAEKIDVSKRKGSCRRTQEEIITLMVEKAQEGRTVVRLKGGDPLVFGRGGEEARALHRAGIPFEIVPGVSSVSAVPAYAGISITDREYASSFGVYSAHRKGGLFLSDGEWQRIAQGPDTLVFLMGRTRCAMVVEKLLEFGRPPSTPIALICSGTTPQQKRVVGTLEAFAAQVEKADLPGPGLLVVGRVVDMIPEMDWFERRLQQPETLVCLAEK